MQKDEVKIGENIIFETKVAYKHREYDTLLTITEKHMLFQCKKGLFKKRYKVVKDLLISDIKIVDDKAKIKHKKNKIIIQTIDDKVSFECTNSIEGMKTVAAIKKQLFGENFVERTSRKGINIFGRITKTAVAAGGLAVAAKVTVTAIKNNKEKIKDAAVTIAHAVKR